MTTYTPTKRNVAHATAKGLGAVLAEAVALGVDAVDDVEATGASLTTDLTGSNNDLVFSARADGTDGNRISIAYVDPEEETAEESVSVVGTYITVTLRSVGGTLSTAAQVAAAIGSDDDADALVEVENAPANNGTGVVTEMEPTYLSGGVDLVTAEELIGLEAGLPLGEVIRISSASAISVEDAMHIALALNGPGYLAFYTKVAEALADLGPEGFAD